MEKSESALRAVQAEAVANAEVQWRAGWNEELTRRIDASKNNLADEQRKLAMLMKSRDQTLDLIAKARSTNRDSVLLEDELHVLRKLRQQLLQRKYLLRLELAGVTLPDDRTPLTGDKTERLSRELDELRREVQRLKDEAAKHKK